MRPVTQFCCTAAALVYISYFELVSALYLHLFISNTYLTKTSTPTNMSLVG